MSNIQLSTFNIQTSTDFWSNRRVIVTGGAGFLGSFIVEKLKERGAAEIIVPRIEEYDLTEIKDIQRLFDDVSGAEANLQHSTFQPSNLVIIHLAALAGGIGANRARPADFFYINLMMGVQLMHEAWKRGVEKFVALGTIWLRKCCWCRLRHTGTSMVSTRSTCCRSICMDRAITLIWRRLTSSLP
jgi:GDP-L-fucose synthase